MRDKNGKLIFRPTDNTSIIIVVLLILGIIVSFFIEGRLSKSILYIITFLLVLTIIVLIFESKKTYLEIQENNLTVGTLDIPSFKTVEKYVQYSDIENITMFYNSTGSNYGNQVQIKLKGQRKKIVIPGLSDKSFTEIKENFIKKGLVVYVYKRIDIFGTKKMIEEFNKNH